ncbi:MAG: hypothetical protein ABIZ04_27380 [Opitutus sp.]
MSGLDPGLTFFALISCVLLLSSAARRASGEVVAAPAAVPPSEGAKRHTLFMGVDLAAAQDNQFYPVRDVSGWLVRYRGERKRRLM